jgi:uncharacterized phiE125 gp8 family phage protein
MIDIACDWSLVAAPAQEPLTIAEAKAQASMVSDDDNALINAYIASARQQAESYLGRGLLTQTWQVQLSGFADVIWLPRAAPLQTVSSVKYYDTAGVLQTLATSFYTVDAISEPGRIVRAPNQSWPAVQVDRLAPVLITYVCGWNNTSDIPELIKHGMRLYVSYCDADRMGDVGAETARKAAESCWRAYGQVFWRPPQLCLL